MVLCIVLLPPLLGAQAPHGGAGVALQPGPNVNAAGGIVNPGDPAAFVKSDILMQRQNETVVAASTRNPDHILAAANDYRFVDFTDPDVGGGQSFVARLIARLFRRPAGRAVPAAAAASVGAWTGVYRSCDRGRTWIGSALPGGPLDNSPAAQLPNPLKQLTLDAVQAGGHAETTDPFLIAGPGGRMHMVVLGFVRFQDNSVGNSRMFYASYTDRNNLEGGSCFNFDFVRQIDTSSAYVTSSSPNPFIDKPSLAVDKDGMIVVSYTLFTDAVKSKIVIARSLDGGATWTRTMPLLSLGFLRNHGTSTTIDPLNGVVYVAWRLFYQDWPLMVMSRSYDRGRTFLPATPISEWWPARSLDQIVAQLKAARLRPFDQFNETPGGDPARATARSLAFPTIAAGVVNGQTRLFAAWQERARVDTNAQPATPAFGFPYSGGSPRVMFTMSSDGGWSWTARRAIDAGMRNEHPLVPGFAEPRVQRPSGPQLQPVLSMSGLTNPQLVLMYYEARDELAAPFGSNFVSGIERQMDVRSARINPSTGQLVAPSVQVAQYTVKANSSPVELTETAPGYYAVSRGNLWMYGAGTKGFFGDYPHLAPSTVFEFDTGTRWKWSTEPTSSLAIWTDHRDVQFPGGDINGDWTGYTPINASSLASCSAVAMRNANPYFTEIAGVVAGSPQNFKRLNVQRAFVTYVENRTAQDRAFRLTLTGTPASFDQFAAVPVMQVQVQVFANSSHTQTIWVAPNMARPTASAKMAVVEIDMNGTVVPGGYRTSVTLNPDPNNDALTPIPTTAPVPPGTDTSIAVTELHNPQVSAPQVSAFNITAPQVSAPQVSAPQVSAPQVSAPQVSAPQVSAPQVSAPQVSASTPGDGNEGTDLTYTVTNTGNTESTYNAFLNVPQVQEMLDGEHYDFQLLITRTSLVPGFTQTTSGCVPAAETKVQVIANLQIPSKTAAQFQTVSGAPSDLATFSVGPQGGAAVPTTSADGQSVVARDEVKITLRAIRLKPLSAIPANLVFEPAEVVLTVVSTSTNVLDGIVQPDGTQPGATATSLPDLAIANFVPSVAPRFAVPGSAVTLSAWRHVNLGSAPPNADGNISNGFYLSTDAVIDPEDTRLDGNSNTNSVLPPGGGFDWGGPTVTIPASTVPGAYYIGILVDESGDVTESNETNNYVSEPITIIAPGALSDPVGDAGEGNPDLVSGSVAIAGTNLMLSVRFAPGTFNAATTVAQFALDTDQQPTTGHQGSDSGCVNDNGIIGIEYVVDMGSTAYGSGASVRAFVGPNCNLFGSGTQTAPGTVTYSTDGLDAVIPLNLLGNDDGLLNFKVVASRYLGPGFTGVLDRMSDIGVPPGSTSAPPSGGMIASVSPLQGKPGEGLLVVRGTGLPTPSSSLAIVSNGTTTTNGFVFQSPSTTSAYWVRLPADFPLGSATIQLDDPNAAGLSNAFPITVAATPGTPIITAVLNSDFISTTTVSPGETIYIQADGIDTSGAVTRFQQPASNLSTEVPSTAALSNQTIGLVAVVPVPIDLSSGPVNVSIRQGASLFSATVTLTVVSQ